MKEDQKSGVVLRVVVSTVQQHFKTLDSLEILNSFSGWQEDSYSHSNFHSSTHIHIMRKMRSLSHFFLFKMGKFPEVSEVTATSHSSRNVVHCCTNLWKDIRDCPKVDYANGIHPPPGHHGGRGNKYISSTNGFYLEGEWHECSLCHKQ